jgi:hypothetical protein
MIKLNLGSGLHTFPKSEGWINVDRKNVVGVDRVMDLFTFPWDFPDNSCDDFYLGHIIEHIPHEPKFRCKDGARYEELKDLDGFFCFFAEIYRIGINGAKVQIICPFGMTYSALQDPTHTRSIVPQTFAYLTDEMRQNIDFNYQLPFLYTVKEVKFDMPADLCGDENKLRELIDNHWNVTRTMYARLEIIK